MEENVALDSSKQKKFVKSLKGIKKLIKKTKETTQHTPLVLAPNKRQKFKKRLSKRKPKGLVYLSHIPHGFFEHQMTEYFKQFGGVTNVRVIRSKRTGNSRGSAFVEFKEPAVAEIVVETMNNYLMGKRIIKAEIIPPEKQKRARRMNWTATHNPGFLLKKKTKKNFNANKNESGDLKRARKILNNLLKTKTKLNAMGIQFDFDPVDVPNELQDKIKELKMRTEDATDKKEKQTKKKQEGKVEDKKEKSVKQNNKKLEKFDKAKVDNETKVQTSNETKKGTNPKNDKAVTSNAVANKKLKEKGVIPLDDFIKVQSDEEESGSDLSDEEVSEDEGSGTDISAEEGSDSDSDDSAEEFDEEAFEKMADSSESLLSGEDDDSDVEEDESESDEEPPILTKKNKGELIVPKTQKKPENKKVQQVKRKAAPKVEVSPKKPKFEKKNDKKLKKKQFKVKN